MHQNLTIILPEDVTFFDGSTTAKHLKSMLLLHGLSSDETTYIRYTSIERYANEHQLAIIMLTSIMSGYANMVYGHSYYDYILKFTNMCIKFYHYLEKKIILLQDVQWAVMERLNCANSK